MSWTNDYIGIPYQNGGRSREGADCWGLACLVLREKRGKEIPLLSGVYQNAADAREIDALVGGQRSRWQEITPESAEPFDLILLRIGRHLCHVGVVVEPGLMLHLLRGCNAVVERYDGPLWERRLAGIFRWQ